MTDVPGYEKQNRIGTWNGVILLYCVFISPFIFIVALFLGLAFFFHAPIEVKIVSIFLAISSSWFLIFFGKLFQRWKKMEYQVIRSDILSLPDVLDMVERTLQENNLPFAARTKSGSNLPLIFLGSKPEEIYDIENEKTSIIVFATTPKNVTPNRIFLAVDPITGENREFCGKLKALLNRSIWNRIER